MMDLYLNFGNFVIELNHNLNQKKIVSIICDLKLTDFSITNQIVENHFLFYF